MVGLICILVFVGLMGFPGFYITTRKIFPKKSKKMAMWISIGVTTVLIALLAISLLTATA